MRYYIIAGERSGDLHGSNLIKALHAKDSEAVIRCWGGDAMQTAGGDLVVHYKEMAFMGFWEVFVNLKTIQSKIKFCKQDLLTFKPDAIILIDYAGFNMRIAKFAHQQGIPVHYYISPKIWAWNQKRAFKIKKFVDFMYVILPFEKEFYAKFGMDVDYVGNPLLDSIRNFQKSQTFEFANQNCVAVLPGSRAQEVQHMMDLLYQLAAEFPNEQFVVAGVGNLPADLYQTARQLPNVNLIIDQTYDLLAHAKAAIVTSGTATLETALFEVPQVVVYKTGKISYAIAKQLIRVEFISLVNLILGKEVVKELIQEKFNLSNLRASLQEIISEGEKRNQILADYTALKQILGDQNCSEKMADLMVGRVRKAIN